MSICPSSCPHTLTDCISCTDMCLWITSTLNAHNTLRFWLSNRGSSGYAYSSRKLHQMAAIIVLIKQPHGTYASDGTTLLHFADTSYQGASAQILNFTVSIFSEIPLRYDLSLYVYVFVVHKLDFRFDANETSNNGNQWQGNSVIETRVFDRLCFPATITQSVTIIYPQCAVHPNSPPQRAVCSTLYR
jgi:hypothetical protein